MPASEKRSRYFAVALHRAIVSREWPAYPWDEAERIFDQARAEASEDSELVDWLEANDGRIGFDGEEWSCWPSGWTRAQGRRSKTLRVAIRNAMAAGGPTDG